MIIDILHLYPKEMNLYGDHGNVLTLQRRLEWRGYQVRVTAYEPDDKLPEKIDIIFGGGGQDSGQEKSAEDLHKIAPQLKKVIDDDTPTLVICGLYQLFGKSFIALGNKHLDGANILPLRTIAGPKRMIGNIVIDTKFGEVVGYENHSGITQLNEEATEFGKVVKGHGNSGLDGTEGCIYKNCIGTYLHGPLLPKNPKIADFLIKTAIENQTGKSVKLEPLDDKLEKLAHTVAASRPA